MRRQEAAVRRASVGGAAGGTHEAYGKQQPNSAANTSSSQPMRSIYAGVTGIDLAPASIDKSLPSSPPPDTRPVFSAVGGRHYHRLHDCRELRTAHSIVAGSVARFLLERKVQCPACRRAGQGAGYTHGPADGLDAGVAEWLRRQQPGPSRT
jgi:hypothetical protein